MLEFSHCSGHKARNCFSEFLREISFDSSKIYFHVKYECHFYAVWKNAKFSLTETFFREMTEISSLVKTFLSRNLCQKSERELISVIFTL